MASQEILLSTCDRCTTEVHTPLDRKHKKRAELVLPHGWLHVSGNTATALVFEMDLCEDCKQVVVEVAGKARTSHTSSSKPSTKSESKKDKNKAEGKNDGETEVKHPTALRLAESS